MAAAHLAVVSGAPPRALRLTPGEVIAGRLEGVALVLPQVEVSRRHCRFHWDGAQCVVEDLGSTRGTRVNGTRISVPTALKPGDQIGVGPVVVQFALGEPPAGEAAGEGSAAPAMAAPLLVHGQPATQIPTGAPAVLGRDPGLEIILSDPGVSRRHAELVPVPGGGCMVRDLHSSAGTFVNGRRFDEHELTVGDRVQIGPFFFQYDGAALVRLAGSRGAALHAQEVVQRVGEKTLLHGVTFAIPSSFFVGILGPSGAGKSTLLNTLAGLRPPQGGQVLIDRENLYSGRETTVSSGYVPQEDIVHRELTVLQALRFAARLRLPRSTPAGEIERLLEQTLEQLGLAPCAHLPIGRLSGGQRKRVSVGAELLARPSVLFLDEPSSGLDPATEFQLMELLRDLADSGCTIICTTHVIENAFLMDELLILMGGHLAFQGNAQQAREYFGVSRLIALYERLQQHAPAEWQARLGEQRPPPAAPAPAAPARPQAGRAKRRPALPILLQRQAAIFSADGRNWALVLGEPVVVALLVAWITTQAELGLFFSYLAVLWFGCSNAAQEIVKERPIFQRERVVGVGTHAYLISKFVFQFLLTGVQALLLYGTLGLCFRELEGAPVFHLLSLLGLALASVGLGTAISALAGNLMQAVLVVPLILIPQILFCGQPEPAFNMKPSVYRVAELMPSFAAQELMETSFFWQHEVTGELLSNHHTAFTNLNRMAPVRLGQLYQETGPTRHALAVLAAWAGLSYLLAWAALRRRA